MTRGWRSTNESGLESCSERNALRRSPLLGSLAAQVSARAPRAHADKNRRALRRPRLLTRRAVGRFPHDPDSRSEEMAGILKMRTHECYSQYFYHLRGILWARNNRESRVHGELDLVQLYSRRSRGGIVAPVLTAKWFARSAEREEEG